MDLIKNCFCRSLRQLRRRIPGSELQYILVNSVKVIHWTCYRKLPHEIRPNNESLHHPSTDQTYARFPSLYSFSGPGDLLVLRCMEAAAIHVWNSRKLVFQGGGSRYTGQKAPCVHVRRYSWDKVNGAFIPSHAHPVASEVSVSVRGSKGTKIANEAQSMNRNAAETTSILENVQHVEADTAVSQIGASDDSTEKSVPVCKFSWVKFFSDEIWQSFKIKLQRCCNFCIRFWTSTRKSSQHPW